MFQINMFQLKGWTVKLTDLNKKYTKSTLDLIECQRLLTNTDMYQLADLICDQPQKLLVWFQEKILIWRQVAAGGGRSSNYLLILRYCWQIRICGVRQMVVWKQCCKPITWYVTTQPPKLFVLFKEKVMIWRQVAAGGPSSNYLLSGTGLSDPEILERERGWEVGVGMANISNFNKYSDIGVVCKRYSDVGVLARDILIVGVVCNLLWNPQVL